MLDFWGVITKSDHPPGIPPLNFPRVARHMMDLYLVSKSLPDGESWEVETFPYHHRRLPEDGCFPGENALAVFCWLVTKEVYNKIDDVEVDGGMTGFIGVIRWGRWLLGIMMRYRHPKFTSVYVMENDL